VFFLVPRLGEDGNWLDALGARTTRSVNLELTSNCNLRCTYCPVSQPDYAGKDMGPELVDRMFAELRTRKVEMVCLNGHGETTMLPGWQQKVGGFVEHFPVSMTTNLSKVYSEDELLTLARFKSINVSLDTADARALRQVRRSVDLDRIIANIALIRERAARIGAPGPNLHIFCTVHDQNALHVEELARLAVSLKAHAVQFTRLVKYRDVEGATNVHPVSTMSEADRHKAREAIDGARALLEENGISVTFWGNALETIRSEELSAAAGNGIGNGDANGHADGHQPGGGNLNAPPSTHEEEEEADLSKACLDPWVFTQIQADGSVFPCCAHSPVGTVGGDHTLGSVLNNDTVRHVRRGLLLGRLDPECATCTTRKPVERSELRRTYVRNALVGIEAPIDSAAVATLKRIYCGAAAQGPLSRVGYALMRRAVPRPLLNGLILRAGRSLPPELEDHITFENVQAGHFGIGDRLYLHPNDVGRPPATARFRRVPLTGCQLVDLDVYIDHEMGAAVQFDLAILDSPTQKVLHEDSRVVAGSQRKRHWLSRTKPIEGLVDVVFRARMAEGAGSNRYAWAYIGYPMFVGAEAES
jgi:molybdenum cofactor biosynthesis enzyme MoaA